MIDEDKAYQATPAATLEDQITNPCIAKNEREWWAHHEIERLQTALNARCPVDAMNRGMSPVEAAVYRVWGERCPDFEPECLTCKAWAEYDDNAKLRAYALKAFTVVEFCCGEGFLLPYPHYDCDDLIVEGVDLLRVESSEEARAALGGENG